ncbi:hypothetical protein MRQ36_12490 [Micromonospora sp. R77]|uniref:hypothetical protein n=1 Tax=Micromonospora sp. R77 TaxID=2925836 RepID=UPI001F602968|nr:hypothetical protein [Micromonospora sp. R77]MCI4063350.1 hypothetical protein [Micromonospora sp. R77]
MSAGLVTAVALLGGLAGGAAPVVARRFTTSGPPDAGPPDAPPVRPAASPSLSTRPARPGWGSAVGAAVGAVVLGGLAADRGGDPALPALLLVAAVGLVLVPVDLACLRLPDPLVAAVAVGGGLGLAGAALATGAPGRLLPALAGAALSSPATSCSPCCPARGSGSVT